MTLSELLHMVGRWWAPAAVLGLLLGAGGAALVWYLFEPKYEAIAWLKVDARPTHLAFEESRQQADPFLLTQMEIIRSPLILDAAVQRREFLLLPGMQEKPAPAEWLARKIGVRQVGQSELLQVSLEHPRPATSAAVVNAVVDSYLDLQLEQSERRTRHVIELLEEEKTRRAEELEQLRAKVRDIVEQQPELAASGLSSLGASDSIGDLQNQLIALEVESEVLKAQLESGQGDDPPAPIAAVELALDQTPQVQRIHELLGEKQALLAETRSLSVRGDATPAVRRLVTDVAFYEQELSRIRERLRPRVAEAIRREASLVRAEELEQIHLELAAKETLRERLSEQLTEKLENGGTAGPWALELQFAQTELARAEAVFAQIADRAEALSTEIRAPNRVSVIRRASLPTRPVETLPIPKMAAAALGGFFLPFLLFVALERRLRRVGESHQLERDAHLPVIGEVVKLPERCYRSGREFPRRVEKQRRIFEESIDSLRMRLLLSDELRELQTLTVASAVSGEGKTRVAAHLAVSLARATNKLVLIVDADLRAPEIHALFEVDNDIGLADVLDGKCPPSAAIAATWCSNLHALPAGRAAKSPSVLFSGEALADCLQQLRETYAYIILDSPPVLSASEALVVSKASDSVLLCAMCDVSRTPQIKLAYERLSAAGADTLGAVLSGVPRRTYARTYGRYDAPPVVVSSVPRDAAGEESAEQGSVVRRPR
ncbi:MAG: polysaccharide biosynthesis tyrosine autokinase [Planctomycetes bacterium]|nr:polysaccharide biosynthesis tyrosine autokinase [Planctomycetota bacterium]